MGGREGNRGYLLQALIAVLTVLENQNCCSIAIEPDDENEKVDIKYWDQQEKYTVIQVKSSINNFGKTEALNYLVELMDGSPEAQSYDLTLLGTFTSDTIKFFNKFKAYKGGEVIGKYSSIYNKHDQISTNLKALDLKALDGHIESCVHKFLSNRGYLVHHPVVVLIALGLSAQFSRFANDGKKIAKADLEKQIIEWIHYKYSKQINSRTQLLDLIFYCGGSELPKKHLTDRLLLFDISGWKYAENQISKLKKLYNEIEEIKLPAHSDEERPLGQIQTALSGMFKQEVYQPAGFTEAEIRSIYNLSLKILKFKPEPTFFQVGNLKQSEKGSILWSLHHGRTYIGTDLEKQKQDLLDDLNYGLHVLEDLYKWWDKVKTYRIIPLAIENAGDDLNQDIELQISLPISSQLLTSKNFPFPKYQENLDKLSEEGGLLEYAFAHHTDTRVNAYNSRLFRPFNFKISNILGSRNEDSKKHFSEIIDYLFDYQFISGPSDQINLSCSFRFIKPGEKIALPAYLFVKHEDAFKIKYQLRSNQCGGIINELEVT
jgi:hypothetical protein